MGGTSTYGYQTSDGKIHYCVYRDYMLLDVILSVFQKGEVYQIQDSDGEVITVDSEEEYFSDKLCEEEDSNVRGFYKLDGTFVYKFWGDSGYFTYKRTK